MGMQQRSRQLWQAHDDAATRARAPLPSKRAFVRDAHASTRLQSRLLCLCTVVVLSLAGFALPAAFAQGQAPTQQAPALLRASANELLLRAGVAPVQGEVLGVSLQGVHVVDGASHRWLSWDMVRSVPAAFAAEAEPFAPLAEKAWRARTRLARGDVSAAEPLFEQLSLQLAQLGATNQPKGSPQANSTYESAATSAMVAAGLLRCRLHRQAQIASVEAWLALLASGEDAPAMNPLRSDLLMPQRTLLDREMLLCPDLPPLWVPGAGLRALRIEQGLLGAENAAPQATNAPQGEGGAGFRIARRRAVARVLVELYALSARHAMGEGITLSARPASDAGPEFAGARLVWDVLAAQAGTPEQIQQARGHLASILSQISEDEAAYPGWVESWTRTALGRSLMASSQSEERATGIAVSLAVPALLADDSPYLAGLCLADVAALRLRQGQISSAKQLRDELRRQNPTHPALAGLEAQLAAALAAQAASDRSAASQSEGGKAAR